MFVRRAWIIEVVLGFRAVKRGLNHDFMFVTGS
jgi:hypothetical protein